eukprot:1150725-Pelagomonas_calceolata.AAC.6
MVCVRTQAMSRCALVLRQLLLCKLVFVHASNELLCSCIACTSLCCMRKLWRGVLFFCTAAALAARPLPFMHAGKNNLDVGARSETRMSGGAQGRRKI